MGKDQPSPFFVYSAAEGDAGVHVTCLQFGFEDSVLLVGTSDGVVRFFSQRTHRRLGILDLRNDKGDAGNSVLAAIPCADGKLFTHLRNASIGLYKVDRGHSDISCALLWRLPFPTLTFCPGYVLEALFVAPVLDGEELQTFALNDGGLVRSRWRPNVPSLRGANVKFGAIMRVLLVRKWDILYAFAGYENGELLAWSLGSTRKLVLQVLVDSEAILSLAHDPPGETWVVGTAGDTLHAFSWKSESQFERVSSFSLPIPGCADVQVRPDGKLVAMAGWDANGRVFELRRKSGKLSPLAILRYHESTVNCVAFSQRIGNASNVVALGSKDGRVSLWRLY